MLGEEPVSVSMSFCHDAERSEPRQSNTGGDSSAKMTHETMNLHVHSSISDRIDPLTLFYSISTNNYEFC